MRILVCGLSVAAAIALFGSAAQADCFEGHKVTATAPDKPEIVAMSTSESTQPTPADEQAADAAAAPECPDGATECVPPRK
jgi:hypothetical protein